MILTLSAVALFGVLALVLLRGRHVGPFSALVLFLFGFFTAGTGAAGTIRAVCLAVANAARQIS
ncbi:MULTISPECIES: hypothetical protein [Streptomyces]|uniref:hypothetical protein n=1 Tax=Streptomyces TaxID=1883 RepID=UPI00073E05FD|nr:hypothetical protein [Streptomyces sp. EAS-AB2608]BCM66477.1 hypothetical protein EASAB2608_01811 [Streptomyces sp. EAS-AB2608]CUW28061.1 hypothetical protein TUE45_02791 [Streptomyces reticuli]